MQNKRVKSFHFILFYFFARMYRIGYKGLKRRVLLMMKKEFRYHLRDKKQILQQFFMLENRSVLMKKYIYKKKKIDGDELGNKIFCYGLAKKKKISYCSKIREV